MTDCAVNVCDGRVCANGQRRWHGIGSTFIHLLLTGQRWSDAMIENIHSVATHSKTFYRLFHSGRFACDTCYLWFCTRGDVLFLRVLAIWDDVESSMHWMHLDETAPACVLHVYASPVCEPPLSTSMKYIFQIYIPMAVMCGGHELQVLWYVWFTNKYHKSSLTECRARLNLFYMCFVHAWRVHPALCAHTWSKTVISVGVAQCPVPTGTYDQSSDALWHHINIYIIFSCSAKLIKGRESGRWAKREGVFAFLSNINFISVHFLYCPISHSHCRSE